MCVLPADEIVLRGRRANETAESAESVGACVGAGTERIRI